MARREPVVLPVAGALALVVGVFAPLANVDVYGDVSLFDVSEQDQRLQLGDVEEADVAELQSLILLGVGAATLLVVLTRSAAWLPLCAVGAWAGLLYPLLERWLVPRDESALGQLKEAFTSAAGDLAVDVFGELALDLTHLRWGGGVLLAGGVLLTVAAFRRRR